ncbi:MAG TPA: 6-carboxytetrahydropterin synthase [Alphaproteobacteria bacterium]|jgi:6-pyruvoyl-tetrahydropterin synthase|nr:6-carboxytetrahydropterin synthase [Alphaproteobacteria bacterium]
MFSLTVSDHFMIAHSFRGEIFGPAQRLHGATYAVELELRRVVLDDNGLVADIGLLRRVLRQVLDELDYRNLDEERDFSGRNTTTEYLAQAIHGRAAARIRAGAVGPAEAFAGLKVTLRESPVAWAAYDAAI